MEGRLPLRREQVPEIIPSHSPSFLPEHNSESEGEGERAVNKITFLPSPICCRGAHCAAPAAVPSLAALLGNLARNFSGAKQFRAAAAMSGMERT